MNSWYQNQWFYAKNITKFPYHNWFCVHVSVITSIALFHSAIIEHTNRVIYLEDDDVAAVDATGSKLYTLSVIY